VCYQGEIVKFQNIKITRKTGKYPYYNYKGTVDVEEWIGIKTNR